MLARSLIAAAVILAVLAILLVIRLPRTPSPARVDWDPWRAGPTDSLRVAYVGHSLFNHRDPHGQPPRNVMDWVAVLAESAQLEYHAFDHTLFGSPLSVLWAGAAHAYERNEPQMRVQREKLFASETLDAVVLTEGLPVLRSMSKEHSAYYAQEFACAAQRKNPAARVYVYESWSHLQASDPDGDYPPVSAFDWRAHMRADRANWEELAAVASTGRVPPPGLGARLRTLTGDGFGCDLHGPLFIVPVGAVMVALSELVEREDLPMAEGRPLELSDLVQNPLTSWPQGWPLEHPLSRDQERSALAGLGKRYPNEELDDVHASDLGSYVAAATHFAVLYRRSPLGLPAPAQLSEAAARRVQELIYEVVQGDPRTGVR